MLTLLRIGWTNLKRDRVAQALTFLLPIVFFSIFASVFGGQSGDQTPRIRVAVVDEDGSDFSRRIIDGLRKEPGLRVRTTTTGEADAPVLDRASAERIVKSGDVPVAVIIPRGMGAAFAEQGFARERPESAGTRRSQRSHCFECRPGFDAESRDDGRAGSVHGRRHEAVREVRAAP